jgi:alpha-1,3-mannosyltransferase
VFTLLATLTGHHTRFCLRKAQPAYRRQVYERYEPLVGYERKRSRRGLTGALKAMVPKVARRGLFSGAEEQSEVEQIFSHAKDHKGMQRNYDGHKYFFAINLVRLLLLRLRFRC